MNEYIEIRFRKPSGARLRVARQTPGGIEFEETDPLERTVGFQLNPRGQATAERMRRIAQVKGWGLGEFRLSVSVEDGNIRLRGVDADSLPEGYYSLRVEVEEAATQQGSTAIGVEHDGHATLEVTVLFDVRDLDVDLTGCDAEIARLLDSSEIDGEDGVAWVQSAAYRPTRRACLMNLLASLRVRPTVSDMLIDQVSRVLAVANDRAYMKVDRALLPRLEALVLDPSRPFYREGTPTAPIHGRLLDQIPPAEKPGFTNLLSFRGEGRPSLQMVIAVPPATSPHTYAEFDLDLGNPLQDVLGFIVHMGELLDGKPTNHLDLRKVLAKTSAREFLYYRVVAG